MSGERRAGKARSMTRFAAMTARKTRTLRTWLERQSSTSPRYRNPKGSVSARRDSGVLAMRRVGTSPSYSAQRDAEAPRAIRPSTSPGIVASTGSVNSLSTGFCRPRVAIAVLVERECSQIRVARQVQNRSRGSRYVQPSCRRTAQPARCSDCRQAGHYHSSQSGASSSASMPTSAFQIQARN